MAKKKETKTKAKAKPKKGTVRASGHSTSEGADVSKTEASEDNVAQIGHNSGDDNELDEDQRNIVQRSMESLLENHDKRKEIAAYDKAIKADLKANNIAITPFNHNLRLAKMEAEVRQNFMEDCTIIAEAMGWQEAFDFDADVDPDNADDPLAVAEAEAGA